MSLNADFTKKDLMTGDTVFNSKGSFGVVLKGTAEGDLIRWLLNRQGEEINKYRSFILINDDLTFVENPEHRITKVMRTTDPHDYLEFSLDDEVIYEEPETKEMTMDEIEEALGHKVKIVNKDDEPVINIIGLIRA